MTEEVKATQGGTRPYRSPRRAEQAAQTRRAVLDAARTLLDEVGYPAMTVAQIARRAGVAVDTVYASVGRKPQPLRRLVETALSGTDAPVPAARRDYVQRIRAASGARERIEFSAAATAAIRSRTAPVFLALRATGELREDLTDDEVADVLWSMNAAEYGVLLVRERGWTPDRFSRWIVDACCWREVRTRRPLRPMLRTHAAAVFDHRSDDG